MIFVDICAKEKLRSNAFFGERMRACACLLLYWKLLWCTLDFGYSPLVHQALSIAHSTVVCCYAPLCSCVFCQLTLLLCLLHTTNTLASIAEEEGHSGKTRTYRAHAYCQRECAVAGLLGRDE